MDSDAVSIIYSLGRYKLVFRGLEVLRRTGFAISLLVLFLSASTIAFAVSEEEKTFLNMYFSEDELQVVSATRSLQSISRVAENMTVVTKEDIELMNAHTLADVLNTINGVEIQSGGGSPGNKSLIDIQGSSSRHVAVFMDGIPLNNMESNTAAPGVFPVQNIEKIEVVKGPGSSTWGSSLGGVINIITKSPGSGKADGMVSASYGEKKTGDVRAEVSGKLHDFGYYLTAGKLITDGFGKREAFWENSLYAKLTYDISKETRVLFTTAYMKDKGEEGDWGDGVTYSNKFEHLISSLAMHSSVSKEVDLDVSIWLSKWQADNLAEGVMYSNSIEDKYGANARLTYNHDIHSVVIGGDFLNGEAKANYYADDKLKLNTWAIFANDTIALGKLSLIPGIRFDHTNISGNFISPSLGATYEIAKKTLLRAFVARGFSYPSLIDTGASDPASNFVHNPDLKVEKVWSCQAGVETGLLNYLWLKADVFSHNVRDAIETVVLTAPQWTRANVRKQLRQGADIEIRSMPFYNFVLSSGATFMHTKDYGMTVGTSPQYTYDVGLKYDDKKSFRALLHGHYIWWNEDSSHNSKYSSMVFDLNVIKTLYKNNGNLVEVFASGHNLFNGSQYWYEVYKNAGRWFEAGLRYKF